MSSPNKRREYDIMKLMMSDYQVTIGEDKGEFTVLFNGPPKSPYEGGKWKLRVELPQAYPYKSPSIGFLNKIFHPNVDEASGTVCLDVINQTWSPMYNLVNVFDVFLPQLLLYPNPSDPLNGDAASLLLRDTSGFANKVKEYVRLYASPEAADRAGANDGVSNNDQPSSDSSDESDKEMMDDDETNFFG